MSKDSNPEYLAKALLLKKDEKERLLSRMGGKLPRRLAKEKLTVDEALAIQLEIEDEQLAEWREKMQAIKAKEEVKEQKKKDKSEEKVAEKAQVAKSAKAAVSVKPVSPAKPAAVKPVTSSVRAKLKAAASPGASAKPVAAKPAVKHSVKSKSTTK